VKALLILLVSLVHLYAEEPIAAEDSNSTLATNEPIRIEDTSGLTTDEVREKAEKSDEKIEKKISKSIVNSQKLWEELSPTPKQFDWVQTKEGEWFKGTIKAMFDDELEFDSEEMGIYSFDMDDIKRIKSFHIVDVNIARVASIAGILRYKDDKLRIIQGDESYEFEKNQIVSFAITGMKERQNWSGKISISFDTRAGNRDQFDYTMQSNVKRRTAKTRLLLDYIGRVSRSNGLETANDHRVNQKFDIYLTRYFFITPLFSEYYTDKFKNIDTQLTAGVGIGYTVFKSKDVEWDLSGGPAVLQTRYITVPDDQSEALTSASLEISTRLEYELSKITDITYQYKLTYTDEASGRYKHHMVLALENDLFGWLDFDITGIWDHTKIPEVDSNGITPLRNDYQLLVGIGIEF